MALIPASIEQLRREVRRTAAVGRIVATALSDDAYQSCLGRISAIGRGEAWPSHAGRPMSALAQLNLSESSFVPAALAGFAFVSVWLAEDSDGYLIVPDERSNGDGWEVRAYRALAELEPTDGPGLDGITPSQLEWQIVDDYPDWEDLVEAVDYDRLQELLEGGESEDVVGASQNGTKLGGWPSLVQSEISWAPNGEHPIAPTYCLQIDTEQRVGLNLWDNGVLHLGLGVENGR